MGFDLVRVRDTFFDRKGVADSIAPAVKKALSKFGAFVRRRAKSSLKYKAGSAAPGKPAHAHRSGAFTRTTKIKGKTKSQPASPLREMIYFGYDRATQSVVIGPAAGGPRTGAPEKIEHGGTAVVRHGGKRVAVTIRPRPTMQLAFAAERGNAAENFRDLIR